MVETDHTLETANTQAERRREQMEPVSIVQKGEELYFVDLKR